MAIDRKIFYQKIKDLKLFTTLSNSQVLGMETILNYWDKMQFTDLRWLAYMFGTVMRECGIGMMPIEEFGKGKGHSYGGFRKRSGLAYTTPNKIYFGRGYVQVTWFENYELMGRLLKRDLLNKPELAMVPDVAVEIMFEGMTKGASSFGDFTGKCLEQYFNATTEDWYNARRIINGTDHALEIEDHAKLFYQALQKASV